MKFMSKENRISRKNSDRCHVIEYEIGDQDLDFAIVSLEGRYPETGRVINKKCKEIVYIQDGQGQIELEGKFQKLKTGDIVLINAGQKYFWDGKMTLTISCHPAFTVDQHQRVE